MNKTISINLGGILFHIDENAFQKLQNYLDAVRNSLQDDPQGKEEIINDIEIRISEILSDRIKNARQVINVDDVDYIIEIMGKPEDYSIDEALFDDDITRKNKKKKRLYRDPDDKFLGGVCSGIAHYFGIDPIWVRLFWLFFAVTYGSGVLIYLLLWILLPVANTTSQKLEMEGEEVNISNIEKKIREEFNDVSNRFKEGVEGFSEEIKKGNYETKLKTGLQEIISVLSKIFKIVFKNIGKIVGVFLILISGIVLITLLISVFSIGSIEFLHIDADIVQYPPFFYDASIPKGILGIALTILIGVPFFFLFSLGIKIVSNNATNLSIKSKLTLLGLWLLSLLLIVFSAIETNLKFANKATVTIEKNIGVIQKDTISVILKNKDDFRYVTNYNEIVMDKDIEKRLMTNIRVRIKPSDSDKAKIVIFKKASGISVRKAKNIADEIEYSYIFNNGVIGLNSYFFTSLSNKLKNNKVNIVLYIPKGKIIQLDKNIRNFIDYSTFIDADFRFSENQKNSFRMTENGLKLLKSPNISKVNKSKFDKKIETTKTSKIVFGKEAINLIDSVINTDKNRKKRVVIDKDGVKVN